MIVVSVLHVWWQWEIIIAKADTVTFSFCFCYFNIFPVQAAIVSKGIFFELYISILLSFDISVMRD